MTIEEYLRLWCKLREVKVEGFDSVAATFYAGATAMAEIYVTHASMSKMEQYTRERLHQLTQTGWWQCPCCQNYYTPERIVCPVSGYSRSAKGTPDPK